MIHVNNNCIKINDARLSIYPKSIIEYDLREIHEQHWWCMYMCARTRRRYRLTRGAARLMQLPALLPA
jgi:hypothetical protein